MRLRDLIADLTVGKTFGMLTGFAGTVCVLWVCVEQNDVILSLCGLVGACLGWLTGILVAPLSAKEAKQFSVLAKVISGFVTGYLLSKIDPLITTLLTPDRNGVAPIGTPPISTRALIALACYLIAVLMVFCARAYWSPDQPESLKLPKPVRPPQVPR